MMKEKRLVAFPAKSFTLGVAILPCVSLGRTSEESVDRATQYALALDAHALNGVDLCGWLRGVSRANREWMRRGASRR